MIPNYCRDMHVLIGEVIGLHHRGTPRHPIDAPFVTSFVRHKLSVHKTWIPYRASFVVHTSGRYGVQQCTPDAHGLRRHTMNAVGLFRILQDVTLNSGHADGSFRIFIIMGCHREGPTYCGLVSMLVACFLV